MGLPFPRVCEPSQLQQKMRTKGALPRNPWARNRNVNHCAERRRKPAKKGRCEGHFCLTKIRREIVTVRASVRTLIWTARILRAHDHERAGSPRSGRL